MNTIPYIIKVAIIVATIILAAESSLAKNGSFEFESSVAATNYTFLVDQLEKAEFSGAFVVAHQNDKPFLAGFGNNTTVDGRPDKKTLIDIGSITKTVTAVAVLHLFDQGKLSMNDSMSKFFPHAPKEKLGITIHQLLTHSSGLPNYIAQDGEGISKHEFLKRTMNSGMLFKPGEKHEYSNVGYSLLAVIIEQISDVSFEEFIREMLLDLNAPSIGYEAAYTNQHSMLTPSGETIAQNSWSGSPKWELIGNGGMVATLPDLVTFLKKLNEGKIISPASLELFRTPHIREGRSPSHYGYGVVVEDHPKYGRTYWHNGSNGVYSATWAYYLDHELIIVTASNSPKLNSDKAGSIILKEVIQGNSEEK